MMPTEKHVRVSASLTPREIERLDRYRRQHRLSRASALRIAAMEVIPELPDTKERGADDSS